MAKDLTTSPVDRQNVLNNPYALAEIEKAAGITGITFESRTVLLKEQVAAFFDVSVRTVENYLEKFGEELARNGYEVLRGKRLQELKLAIRGMGVPEADFGNLAATPQLAIFDFRAFLNLTMLIAESDRARLLRQAILDIVIDTINARSGGGTKYINRRDEDFLQSAFAEEDYRRHFTDALKECVDLGPFKYAMYTDKIYVSIFREKSKEYRRVLRLEARDSVRETFYAEVLDLIAAFEYGFAEKLRVGRDQLERKLTSWETDVLYKDFEGQPHWKPLVEKARIKMASRDLAFRDALHVQLEGYISPLRREEYERFLGERSKEFEQRLEEAQDVMRRLKDR